MSEVASAPAVLVERQDRVMIVTINRPDARNSVNCDVHVGVGSALEEADKDPDIWAVILTGAGDQAFCAGADLKALSRGERLGPADPVQQAWGFAGYATHHISKPTIAAVNGFALGGGTELTLASDLAVAAETAMFGLPEVKRGILAGAGGAFRLNAQLPPKVAMEILLTGDPINARRALELGLVNAVVPQAQVLDAALKLAARITVNAPLSVQASKRIARGMLEGKVEAEDAYWGATRRESSALMRSEDAREGPRAFAEKRAPVWKAR
ncbi:MAG: enoyl-CoA hydratase [Phenylobacterium sp.]|nr:enoyl-CoA hydratase [Phenylobacterium sp.]